MKRTLTLLSLLLPFAGAFAQEYASTVNVSQPVTAGAVREEKAVEHLMASGTVERGATARYTAGLSVTLQPGFVARAGSVFQATIGPINSRPSAEPGTTLTVRAFPNPFETTTTIEYNLPEAIRVAHTLTDATGQIIRRSDGQQVELAGIHRSPLNLSQLPVGVYLYRVETGNASKILRLVKK